MKNKLTKKKKAIIIVVSTILFLMVAISIVGPILLIEHGNKTWLRIAEPYLRGNEEVQEQIGTIETIECVGMHSVAEEDGRPVYFEVKTDRGTYSITLWMDQIALNEFEVSKHLIESSDDSHLDPG